MEINHDKSVDVEKLATISMQVILHAGNARASLFKAIDSASNYDFKIADELLETANDDLTEAHRVQTETMQLEAEGIQVPYSVLFSHAQDTLMTIKSEQNLIKEMIKLYKRIGEK